MLRNIDFSGDMEKRKNEISSANVNQPEAGKMRTAVEFFPLTPDPPEHGQGAGTPLIRSNFPLVASEQPKKFALTPSRLLDQFPKS